MHTERNPTEARQGRKNWRCSLDTTDFARRGRDIARHYLWMVYERHVCSLTIYKGNTRYSGQRPSSIGWKE